MTYYLSNAGNDAWDGVYPDLAPGGNHGPWKTLAKISEQTFAPGDKILLKRGDTWANQRLEIKGIGTPSNPKDPDDPGWITLGAYGTAPGKPNISKPLADYDADFCVRNTEDMIDPRDHLHVAIKIKSKDGAVNGGWKIQGLKISNSEYGIIALAFTQAVDNILIEDCDFHAIWGGRSLQMEGIWGQGHNPLLRKSAAINFASLTQFGDTPRGKNGTFHNITVKDCTILNCESAIMVPGGNGENPSKYFLFDGIYYDIAADNVVTFSKISDKAPIIGWQDSQSDGIDFGDDPTEWICWTDGYTGASACMNTESASASRTIVLPEGKRLKSVQVQTTNGISGTILFQDETPGSANPDMLFKLPKDMVFVFYLYDWFAPSRKVKITLKTDGRADYVALDNFVFGDENSCFSTEGFCILGVTDGAVRNCTIQNVGAPIGIDHGIAAIAVAAVTNFTIENSEIGYTVDPQTNDGCAIDYDAADQNLSTYRCYLHHCDSSVFAFLQTNANNHNIYNCVIDAGGLDVNEQLNYPSPAAFIRQYFNFESTGVISGNIIRKAYPGQALNMYCDAEGKYHYPEDMKLTSQGYTDPGDNIIIKDPDTPLPANLIELVDMPPLAGKINYALNATATASSVWNNNPLCDASKAVDGVKGQEYTHEWLAAETDPTPTLTITLPGLKTIDTIRLYDSRETEYWTQQGVLTIYKGETVVKTIKVNAGIINVGMAREVAFAPIEADKVAFKITRYEGLGGLSEIEIYGPTD